MTYRPVFRIINIFYCLSILSGTHSQDQLSPELQQTLQKLAQSVKGDVTIEVIEQQIPSRTYNQQNFNPTRQQYQPTYNQFQQQPYRQMPKVNLNGYDAAIIIEETHNGPVRPDADYYVIKDIQGRPFNPGFPPNNNGRPNDFYPTHHHHHPHNYPPGPPDGQYPYNRPPMDDFGPKWDPSKHNHGMNYDEYDQTYDYDYSKHGPREHNHPKHGHNGGYTTENINLDNQNNHGYTTENINLSDGSRGSKGKGPNQGYTTENTNLSDGSYDSKGKDDSAINFDSSEHKPHENNIAGYIGKFPVILLNENEIR
ncbi:unnamed protein product [Callosobruchus maculatus]|uniref:Uncharacterized protein n=1 Tax=Callosobruchus maculatus TaxID=64391 RepID=A0A653D9R9_CALMS|nr:unnamed protein product [Callosobruchus maculatus]